jgi:Uma2 family endonuclease
MKYSTLFNQLGETGFLDSKYRCRRRIIARNPVSEPQRLALRYKGDISHHKIIMSELKTKLPTDTWVVASWEEFIEMADSPAYKKAKCYYRNGQMTIETMSVGPDRASDCAIALLAVNLFCTIKGIAVNRFHKCSYRKTRVRECQPDLSYYIGDRSQLAPQGTSIASLDVTPPPDLVIEVADSTRSDIGEKRLLYEELKVAEYWVIDVKKQKSLPLPLSPIMAAGDSYNPKFCRD